MSAQIHPTAIVSDKAKLGNGVKIGPYCIVESEVELGDNVELKANVYIDVPTTIGQGTVIFPYVSISITQDKKYSGEAARVEIGKNNIIREHVTINAGSSGGGLLTKIGNNCLLMAGAHVAHDCKIADNVVLVNQATLGGHVELEEFVIIGGLSAVHQFVKIGRHAIIGGMSGVKEDVIPFATVKGERATLVGLNLVGLKRRQFSKDSINSLRAAFKELFGSYEVEFNQRVEQVEKRYAGTLEVMEMVNFIKNQSSGELCMPKSSDFEL